MKKVYRGKLKANDGFETETGEISLSLSSIRGVRSAAGRWPMTQGLRKRLLDPTSSGHFRFETDDGQVFDLVAAGKINVLADTLPLTSNGRVPGLLE